jgi:tRNA pseudouridine55 synthase
MNGIIIVDKPEGWTSHDVVAKLRWVLKEKRIGHGGTLDPMATGVLPLFVGRATRAVEFMESADKEYIAGVRFGIITDTQDTTGQVLEEHKADIEENDIVQALSGFLGESQQLPPLYSAVKVQGKKLYEYARKGREVERSPRSIKITEIEPLGYNDGKDEYRFRIVCSKGTYIRTICHDLGQRLGCGAAMSSLRRTRAGRYDISMAAGLDKIIEAAESGGIDKYLRMTDSLFDIYPELTVSEEEERRIKNGADIAIRNVDNGKYRVYGENSGFIAFSEAQDNVLKTIKSFYNV